jgi:xylan 1,4-beta-xylosidase
MKKYYCNPLNLEYRYQILKEPGDANYRIFREAADPSAVLFKGKYYLFPSMCGGFYVSENLTNWDFRPFLSEMPVCDYAPDVRVIGNRIYFCASRRDKICDFYRSADPETEPFEKIEGSFDFWDPALFCDDDGRLYLYWGCSNQTPIYGAELDYETMKIKGNVVELFDSDDKTRGFDRFGDDHQNPDNIRPYIEGAWMNKIGGKYYLQYAIPGTEFNIYGDGCMVADRPLGPYTLCKNNPYSYHPGGFMPGAGHGSTFSDKYGCLWHFSTMRISKNYKFERRLGLWQAGFDSDGGLYCDQRYGDWPIRVGAPAFSKPDFLLLSYNKPATVSSGEGAENLTDENCQTFWRADGSCGEWAIIDLEKECSLGAVQINFADLGLFKNGSGEGRYLDMKNMPTRWRLEGSLDNQSWVTLADKWETETDLAHDFLVFDEKTKARYLKLTVRSLPYNQRITVSALRAFGRAQGRAPEKPEFSAERLSDLDMTVSFKSAGAEGAVILWGYSPDKLYHSYMVFGDSAEQQIGALIKEQDVYVSVEAFNGSGITRGDTVKLKHLL